MFRSVFEWHTLKTIAVVVLVSPGVVALAVTGFVGVFFYKAYVPERMSVTGRVTDSGGKPVKGVEVHAVALPIHDPYSDSVMEPQDTEHTVISDENGRYRFKRLVASVGIKEGRCMQGYDIVACAQGRYSPVIHLCKHPDDRSSVIELADLVLEDERPISALEAPGS